MDDEKVQDQQNQSPDGGPDVDEEITAECASFVHGDPLQDSTGPPKSESKVEILHEHVKKQLIKEGHGQKPTKYSTCFCKYHYHGFFSKHCTTGHGPKAPSTSLRTHGMNRDQ
ncbi:hypothetical protein C5167_004447 [Papaver somniferum]|uniref:Uncharacterized protein n=1 Tax=Papaver somniferum TaxID=3469 RepID=A0A4Y7JBY3_PAPSO|nr:hypothetical protein C5167_004447 [Papaver somniferum]